MTQQVPEDILVVILLLEVLSNSGLAIVVVEKGLVMFVMLIVIVEIRHHVPLLNVKEEFVGLN